LGAIAGGIFLWRRLKVAGNSDVEVVSIDDTRFSIAGPRGVRSIDLAEIARLRVVTLGGVEVIDTSGRVALRLAPEFTNLGITADALIARMRPPPESRLPAVFRFKPARVGVWAVLRRG
jgi:hypothetical protein